MITFDSAAQWQQWFDDTFPAGARAHARDGSAWVVTPRVVVDEVSDGYVRVSFSPWNYDRELTSRFKGISEEASSSYAYVQYVTQDVAEGYPGMIFSGDVASADPDVVAARRLES